MYMDDIKLFAKKEKELGTLRHTMWIYNQDIGIEFGIKKRRQANTEKQKTTHDANNGKKKSGKDRTFEEEGTYKYLGILEADSVI